MDTLKKIIHPNKSHETSTNPSSELPPSARPNAETTAALGNEPNITGTDRPAPMDEFPENKHAHHTTHGHHNTHQHNYNDAPTTHNHADKQPRLGHHHPRQPVGATGLPPNHQPRENFTSAGASTGAGGKITQAEAGNNFPGTNPHPAHSALGNRNASGETGMLMPGQE